MLNKLRLLRGMVACLALAALPAFAAQAIAVQGDTALQRGAETVALQAGTALEQGDKAVSGHTSGVLIRFEDGAQMALRSDSAVQFKSLQMDASRPGHMLTVRIIKGGLRYISGKATVRKRVLFETSTGEIGIRGTDLEIAVTEEAVADQASGTYLRVNKGAATLKASDGSTVDVDPGEVAFGGEPELVARGAGGAKRPAARKVRLPAGVFQPGLFDSQMH